MSDRTGAACLMILSTFLFSVSVKGQLHPHDSLRAKNIRKYPDHFFVWSLLKQRTASFSIQSLVSPAEAVTFTPNDTYQIGMGVYIFEVGAELSFNAPIDERSKERYGVSESRDLLANLQGNRWALDFFSQRYNGFYASEAGRTIPAGAPYPQRKDIEINNTGVNGIFAVDRDKFSLRSAYNFSEHQLRSGGSFIVTGTFNKFTIAADSAVLATRFRTTFGNDIDFNRMRYTTISIAPGYTYSFIFHNFFLNASVSVGPAHHWVYYQAVERDPRNTIAVNSFSDTRLALGYNSDRFYAGMSYVGQSRFVKFEQAQLTTTNSLFRFIIGYRFKEWGILTKRAWDFIPSDLAQALHMKR
jgi:hypothetical protein